MPNSVLALAGFLLTLALLSACVSAEPAPISKSRSARSTQGYLPAAEIGDTYKNPYQAEQHGSLWGFLRARFRSGEWASYDPERYQVPTTSPQVSKEDNEKADTSDVRVTWIGHSTVLLQYRGVNVLTDPMFSDYASPVSFAGPKRITQPALSLAELPRIDVVVISHDHYDHLDVQSIRALGNTPHYFVPLGIKAWLMNQGIDPNRITELAWWQSTAIDVDGAPLTLTATPTQHFSGRGLFDRNETLWASWHIAWEDYSAWFGGDTGYNKIQFKEIGTRFPNIDLGIIPIGAYKPRWFMGPIHVDPIGAVNIHRDIGARRSMGVHWGTFILTAEEIDEPPKLLAKTLASANLAPENFRTFAVGETRHFSPTQQPN